jgi:hypothetical protein
LSDPKISRRQIIDTRGEETMTRKSARGAGTLSVVAVNEIF